VKNLQVHQRKYRVQLGDGRLSNLVTLCAYCRMEEHGQLSFTRAAAKNNSGPRRSGGRKLSADQGYEDASMRASLEFARES
jgi:hypothetical protein